MKKLIYQVYLGNRSKLYDFCTNSVKEYAEKIGADYICQTKPILRIAPDPFMNQREGKTGGWKKLGYLPILEKENSWNHFKNYDFCCIIDADIYIKPETPDIFNYHNGYTVSSVYECDMPITEQHAAKIKSYSNMVQLFNMNWPYKNKTGYDFFNSGVLMYNCKNMLERLKGMSPEEFLRQPIFMDLINGIGPFKWQSEQMLLNYWFRKENIEVQRLEWKWNTLYTAVNNPKEGYFIHFFLRDHLPDNGENIEELVKTL